MDSTLRARMSEEDMNQRIHHMMQQRQQSEISHPQSFVQAPPSPIQVGGRQPPQSQHHSSSHLPYYPLQEPLYHAQQHNLPSQPQPQPQPQPQTYYQHGEPEYFPRQNQTYDHQEENYPRMTSKPPLHPDVPSLPSHATATHHHQSQELLHSDKQSKETHSRRRQQVLCMTPNDINPITELRGQKIIAARVLNIAFPIVDYNVDEVTQVFQFTTNRLNAKAQHWQQASLPLGHYISRYKLLDAMTDTLTTACDAGQFVSHLNRYGTNVCSIEAIFMEKDKCEHDGLYFHVTHNPQLFGMLGFCNHSSITDCVNKNDGWIDHPQTQWTSTKVVPGFGINPDHDFDHNNQNSEDKEKTLEIQLQHFVLEGNYPMNLLPPTHIKLQIPELGDWYNYIAINNTRHGEYKHFEFIDDDGVVHLSYPQLGGCSDLTTITPQLSTCHRNQKGQIYERAYNCRNMPIMLTIELMFDES